MIGYDDVPTRGQNAVFHKKKKEKKIKQKFK